MNKLIISGNLGKDAAKREAGGKTVINFTVAVSDKVKDQTITTWFDCSYWTEKTGILPYLLKGSKVIVDGKLGTREHEGKTYLTVNVNQVELIGAKQEQISQPVAQNNDAAAYHYQQQEVTEPMDDLPF